jgi:hypothetical protein
MLDLYKFHTAPDTLHEFENRWKASPEAAVTKLVIDPNNKEALALVLQSAKAILDYVRKTKKPFPAGLKALGNNLYNIIVYATALGQRVPQVEQILLSSNNVSDILNYIDGLLGHTRDLNEPLIVKAEQLLLQGTNLNALNFYIKRIIKGPWKEAESKLATNDYAAREYVNAMLDGDWSKFDKGQHNVAEKWQDMIEDIINSIIDDINDNGWAIEDEDEDNEPWNEIKLTFVRANADKTSLKVKRDGRVVGKIVKSDGENTVKCYDADGELVTTVKLGQTEDDIIQDLWEYTNDELAGLAD